MLTDLHAEKRKHETDSPEDTQENSGKKMRV